MQNKSRLTVIFKPEELGVWYLWIKSINPWATYYFAFVEKDNRLVKYINEDKYKRIQSGDFIRGIKRNNYVFRHIY